MSDMKELKAAIEAEKKNRVEEFQKELMKLTEQYKVKLVPITIIRADQPIKSVIQIEALDLE
jgi:hypothetical protein